MLVQVMANTSVVIILILLVIANLFKMETKEEQRLFFALQLGMGMTLVITTVVFYIIQKLN